MNTRSRGRARTAANTDFDSLSNRGEYFSAHYFAEQLGPDLKKGLFTTWAALESDELDTRKTPRQTLPALRGTYLADDVRSYFADRAHRDRTDDGRPRTHGEPDWEKRLSEWHQDVLRALGFAPTGPADLTVRRSGQDHTVRTAYHGHGVIALDCGWAADSDTALDPEGPARLLAPLRISGSEAYETGEKLASWLFHAELPKESGTTGGEPPRFILLLIGGVLILADRRTWGEGRYLAASLDVALQRNDRRQHGELATIAALFGLDALRPGDNGEPPLLDTLLKASGDNAVGVSGELRHGLQRSVEIIANAVLHRMAEPANDVAPADIEDPKIPFADELTSEALRFLYRILFLLYAEARPELGILPADDGTYEAGYSMTRLRELVARDEQLVDEEARNGFHLYESLNVLFTKVNEGHRPYGTEPDDDQPGDDEEARQAKAQRRSEDRGLRFEPLRSDLFEPAAIRLIGNTLPDPRTEEDTTQPTATLDLRPRNAALHEVLRLLTMKKGSRRGERGGFISYRNLGINQLGAVYEGLMSYTGFIAEEDLCEVAKNGNPEDGSWMIPSRRQDEYPDGVFVHYDEDDARKGLRGRRKYERGSFVYRLAGRDRETSASYYTPESLTKVTVELALKHLLTEETRAAELLKYKICEPALGSGAFLNEAINQVAEEYLRRRQTELGRSIPAALALTEKQRVKAYIALHNAYGVDLNATAVELAEVSLWLNTMHPGMRAPWFGLHLRRGNSLIGARRAVYAGKDVAAKEKAWLRARNTLPPAELPFSEACPKGAIHHFLLPTPGWASVAAEKEAKQLAPAEAERLATWRRGILKPPGSKPGGHRRSQLERLQAVARRTEFLWDLVVRRMELSEEEISRHIDVWGIEPGDPEFAFLRQPKAAVPKEKVYNDLFEKQGTPYWRLKTLMDTWCALWFWPVDQAALLDGTDLAYENADSHQAEHVLAALPQIGDEPPKPTPIPEQTAIIPHPVEQISLFADDTAPASGEPARPKVPKSRPAGTRRPVVRRRARIPLATLEDWLDFAEALLGTHGEPGDLLAVGLDSLGEVEEYEKSLESLMGMDPPWKLQDRFPWLHVVEDIASEQGFLHWELDFAYVFRSNGGFDLQVGNPPWVRPRWDENAVLAEHEPWFKLADKPSASERSRKSAELLREHAPRSTYLADRTATTGFVAFFSSPQTYPLLVGTQPDLYRCFMRQTWAHASTAGTIGLIHPDSHFTGDKEAALREAAYRRLRVHGDFFNAKHRFFQKPVGEWSHFGVHIYGPPGEIGFDHMSWLVSTEAFRLSAQHDGSGEPPGVRYKNGDYDERPHRSRVVRVDRDILALWQKLTGAEMLPVEQARLLFPVSTAEASAISSLAHYPVRLGMFRPEIARGFDESGAKKSGLIDYNRTGGPRGEESPSKSWDAVILKGTQFGVATPVFKRHDANPNDPYGVDIMTLPDAFVPDTQYLRNCSVGRYLAAQERWIDQTVLREYMADDCAVSSARAEIAEAKSVAEAEVSLEDVETFLAEKSRRQYTEFYRLAWRRQIASNTERALYPALFPPGVAHIHMVHSLTVLDASTTALVGGFWASLPMDYFVRSLGWGDLQVSAAKAMPAPEPHHPLATSLLLRTLRLNCLTAAYTDLWSELCDRRWATDEGWVFPWPNLDPLQQVTDEWHRDTPLRSEYARRAALVEIDALVAVWLGMDADALIAAYRGRFPVLQKFEAVTWFDADGWKLAGNARTIGQRQSKDSFKQLQTYLENPGTAPAPTGYTPPFYKADREREMREAHAVFKARLDEAVAKGEWSR